MLRNLRRSVSRGVDGFEDFTASSREVERVRWLSGIAGVGLVVVLVSVSGFALWSSRSTASAAESAVRASRSSDQFAAATRAVAAEESLERKYRLEPSPQVRARYDRAAADLVAALRSANSDGDAPDRAAVAKVLRLHALYLNAIDAMFAAVDRGDTAEVLRIDGGEVDPQFDQIETSVQGEADEHHEAAVQTLENLRRLEEFTANATPAVFAIGLVLIGVFTSFMRRVRKVVDRQHAQAQHLLSRPLDPEAYLTWHLERMAAPSHQ